MDEPGAAPEVTEEVLEAEGEGAVVRNTTWTVAQQIFPMAATVFLTPYILHHLGVIRYGLFVLTGSTVSLLGNFDGGIRGTSQRYFGVYAGQRDVERMTKLLVTLIVLISAAGAAASVIGWFVAPPIVDALKMPANLRPESVFLFRTLGVLIAIGFLHNLFVAILQAHGRFALIAKTGFGVYVVWSLGLIATARFGWGLRGIAIVYVGQQFLMTAVILRASLRYVRRSHAGFLSRAETVEFLRFGGRVQISSLSVLINDKFDALLCGVVLNVKTVAYYNSGTSLSENAGGFTLNALGPLQSNLSNTLGRDGDDAAFAQCCRFQHAWVIATTGLFAAAGAASWFVVTAWLGRSFGLGGTVAVIAMAGTMVFTHTSVLRTYCTVLGKPGIESRFGIVSVVVNVVLTVPFVIVFGAIGVIAATTLGQIVGAVYLLRISQRELHPAPPNPFRSVPVLPAMLTIAVVVALEALVHPYAPGGGLGLIVSAVPAAIGLGTFAVAVVGSADAVDLLRAIIARARGGPFVAPNLALLRTVPGLPPRRRRQGRSTTLSYPRVDMRNGRDATSSSAQAESPALNGNHVMQPGEGDAAVRRTKHVAPHAAGDRAMATTQVRSETVRAEAVPPGNPQEPRRRRPVAPPGVPPVPDPMDRPRRPTRSADRRSGAPVRPAGPRQNGSGTTPTNGGPDLDRRSGRNGPAHQRQRAPIYVAPGRSALLHWRLVALLGVVGVIIGGGYAAVRQPKYTAEAQLYVGKTLSLTNTAAIPGLANGATQIASDYARLVLTSTVTKDAAKRLGHPNSLGGTLSATEIPNSPQIRLDATANSQAAALALANAGAQALVDAVNSVNTASQGQVNGLLQQYDSLESTINQDNQQIGALQGQNNPANDAQIAQLQASVNSNQLQANAINSQFQTSYNPLAAEEQVINIVGPAAAQGSDRKKTLELTVLVGLVAGLLVGVTLASIVDLRRMRRAQGRPAA